MFPDILEFTKAARTIFDSQPPEKWFEVNIRSHGVELRVSFIYIFSWRMQALSWNYGRVNLWRSWHGNFSKWMSRSRNFTRGDSVEELRWNFQSQMHRTKMYFLHWKYLLRLQSNQHFPFLSNIGDQIHNGTIYFVLDMHWIPGVYCALVYCRIAKVKWACCCFYPG